MSGEDLVPWYDARANIVESLEDELMGPAELVSLDEPPLNRIIVGVLHPQIETRDGTEVYHEGLAEDDGAEWRGAGVEGAAETAVSLSHAHKPSSMGLTFTVAAEATPRVRVSVSARRFQPSDTGSWIPTEITNGDGLIISTSEPGRIDVRVGDESLRIAGVVRPAKRGQVRITISLVNEYHQSGGGNDADGLCWFRPRISVVTLGAGFVDRRQTRTANSGDADVRSADFLYRKVPVLGVGHGCAVTWNADDAEVRELHTSFLPSHAVSVARPAGGDGWDDFGRYDLDMRLLGQDSGKAQLHAMVDAYEGWIAARRVEARDLSETERRVGLEHMDLAERCAQRIREGIAALGDPEVDQAFRLMNHAMGTQRAAQDKARGEKPRRQQWRPFQMAFILMNLSGLADPRHRDRDVVDLLWFPTGGGKTEAYLGCIAFSIILRRLRSPGDGGVSAIMRYTLRLLTRQQFERAAGLICAIELIRRQHLPQAAEVTLGLWVGNQATPKNVQDARKILNDIASGMDPDGATPIQLLRCPWCGVELSHKNYLADKDELVIACGESACEFRDGLPLYVVDSDVYRVRPSLLIGTVDKFALMSWNSEVASLLSVDRPSARPDLIVQDELHLISGPLGTMVGLYESALDLACTGAGRPKVVASTATIRRAATQVKAVFDRTASQFPPPGLVPSDSYFAVDASKMEKGNRQYLGVMAPGISQATLLVRIYAALLQTVGRLDVADEVKDSYWTLLAYFNSLRVLGSTYLQVLDDVPDRIGVLATRAGVESRAISQEPVELTSRVRQGAIPGAMKALERSYPAGDSPDVVLATNMISVGLDIDRLGLMVVAGQPQSSSEYIQSTSRVGRRRPGLVVVALNAQRSRDKSHFESFIPIHRALYREVEATTATPFASRARDRGAHGLLVAAVRLLVPELRGDGSAVAVSDHLAEVERITTALVARAERIAGPEEAQTFSKHLSGLVDTWSNAARTGLVNQYGALRDPRSRPRSNESPLLRATSDRDVGPSSYPVGEPPWPTLSSMRDVDIDTHLYVKYLKRGEPR